MASKTGLVTSFINTVPDKVMVTDRILMMEPYDIVLYNYLGTDMGKFNFQNFNEKEYRWLNDTMPDRTSTLGASIGDTTTTTCSITTADYVLVQPGDVWLIGSEQIWVSGMSTTTLTITRGFNGTTAATHDNGAVMTRVGRARIDADDADDSPSTEVSSTTNVTQILQRTIKIARSKLKLAEYGISDVKQYYIDKAMKELMMDLARLPYYNGEVSAGTGNTVARRAGGFPAFITGNTSGDLSDAVCTRDDVDDVLEKIHADGGSPTLFVCPSHIQRHVNDWYEGFVETGRSEQLGGVLIKKLQNPVDGTIIDVVVDRQCPSDDSWLLDPKHIAYYPFDPFFYEELAKDGDYEVGEVVGEYGFVVANGDWHGRVYGFKSSY